MNDGKVLLIERKGAVKLYHPLTGETRTVAELDVHSKEEDGLMGIAIDSDFEQNNWI